MSISQRSRNTGNAYFASVAGLGVVLLAILPASAQVAAGGLQLEGLLLQVGATPTDPMTGKPKSDTLQTLMDFLRRTALNRIKVHAGLDHLAARQLRLDLEGTELQGFSLGVALLRQKNDAS